MSKAKKNQRGEYTVETVIDVAYDFHFTSMDIKEIGKKYNMHHVTARSLASKYTPDELRVLKKKDTPKAVIVIDDDLVFLAAEILRTNNIKFDVPTDYELSIKLESKMNYD
jgi:hypothetical protein